MKPKFLILAFLLLFLVSGGNAIYGSDIGEKIVPFPESGTMILVGGGLIGLAGYGRRFFKK